MRSRDIAILVYVSILQRGYSVYYSSISKVRIAIVSARSALKLGVSVRVFLNYSLCHATNAAVVISK